jgi:hypothetical protein
VWTASLPSTPVDSTIAVLDAPLSVTVEDGANLLFLNFAGQVNVPTVRGSTGAYWICRAAFVVQVDGGALDFANREFFTSPVQATSGVDANQGRSVMVATKKRLVLSAGAHTIQLYIWLLPASSHGSPIAWASSGVFENCHIDLTEYKIDTVSIQGDY